MTENADRIVRPKDLPKIVGVSTRHCMRLEAQGKFPRAIPLGQSARGFLYSELMEWIAERAASRESAA